MNKIVKKEIYKRGLGANNHIHNPDKTRVKAIFTDYGYKTVYIRTG